MSFKRPKVLIATGIYPPDSGGPATYSKLLFDHLPDFNKEPFLHGLDVSVLSFGSVRKLPKGISHYVYFLKLYFQAISCQLIFAQDPVSVGLPAALVSWLVWKPFVLKIVGDYAWEQAVQRAGVTDSLDVFVTKKTQEFPFLVRVLRSVQTLVARRADHIIVPSHYLKKIVMTWGISAEKITVVYNSFDFEGDGKTLENSSKESLKQSLGLDGKIVLTAGRLVPWKGFLAVIDSVIELRKESPNIHLYIIGDGPDRSVLEQKIEETSSESYVHLLGKVEHEEVLQYMRAADVFVLNTQYEGLSHMLLEAMALSASIVTTAVGGNVELIENKKQGFLVPYNDVAALEKAVKEILNNSAEAVSLALEAKKKVSQFTLQNMLKGVCAVFNKYI